MKKQISIILLIILLLVSTVQSVSATTVFLTSDNIIDENSDVDMLNSIKEQVEELSNGQITVVVDNQAPGPGEGSRAIESSTDVSVNLAAACAGNLYILAKYAASSDKQIIFVNTGDFNLDNEDSLRRAWDDNYSNTSFAGINNPGKFLNESGISYIQPLQEYPNAGGSNGNLNSYNEDVNKYIAQEIVNQVQNHQNKSKTIDTSLLITHKLNPSSMAMGSSELLSSDLSEMNGTYNGYSAAQLLYLTSSYLNGNGLETPSDYKEPNSPMQYSILTKDSYSIYEYMEMAGIVKTYMDEHQQAPDYINYQGAYISYYDLQYNFAKITQNHTDSSEMDFAMEYSFDKVNDSIIINLLPFVILALIIITIYSIIRRLKRRRRRKR